MREFTGKRTQMAIEIRTETPLSNDGRNLIAASEEHLRQFYTLDECFSCSAEELAARNTQFFVARLKGRAIGCVALIDQGNYAEVKRLYVRPEARGMGAARALMHELEQATRDIGLVVVKLETGQALAEAEAMYRKLGFVDCAPFGCYAALPSNVFLEKQVGVDFRIPHRSRSLRS